MFYEDPDEYESDDAPSVPSGLAVFAVIKVGALIILCGIASLAIMGVICM